MNKILSCLMAGVMSLLCVSCASTPNKRTNYTPPTVGKVKLAVSSAQDTTTQAQRRITSATAHAVKTDQRLAAAAAKAQTVKERLTVIAKAVEKQPDVYPLVLQVGADVDSLTQELLAAQDENKQLQTDQADAQTQLSSTQQALTGAQTRADELQKDVTTQTNLLNESNKQLNAAIVQGAKDKHNAHVFKWIIIGLAVAATGMLLFLGFGMICLTPPLLYLTLGGPAAVGTFLFFFLG